MPLGIFEASRRGAFSRTDATLANLLGRTPLDAAHVLALPD